MAWRDYGGTGSQTQMLISLINVVPEMRNATKVAESFV